MKLGDHVKELKILNGNLTAEITELNSQIATLEIVKENYIDSLKETKKSAENHIEKRAELEKKLKAEDKMTRLKEIADIRQQWIRCVFCFNIFLFCFILLFIYFLSFFLYHINYSIHLICFYIYHLTHLFF